MDREQPTGGLLRTRWDPGLLRMVGFSLGLHVLVVAVIVVMRPWSRERSMPPPPAYTVELTSLTSLGSNVTPGAPGDRLTGGRAEPRPPAPAADMKPGTAAKVPAPPAERVPVKPSPPPAPPKVETPPTVADEPVRLPEPPKAALPKPPEVSKTPEAPKPEPPKEVAKAPAPPPAAKPSPERSEVPAAAVEAKAEKDVPKKPEAPPEKPPAATPKPEQPTQEAKLPAEAPKPAEKPQPAEAPKKPADEAKKPAPQQATADATKPPATVEKPSATSAETKKAPAQTVERPAQVAAPGAPGAEPAPSATRNDAPPEQDTRYAAAIDRVRRRVETGAGGLMGDGDARQAPSIGGAGPGGGNQVVGAEFLIYYNIMISHIKRTWLWVGHDDTLSVTVHFRIGPEGEIGEVRLERPSADATYDESVLRAVREASPLPPPPAAHRRDFSDVRLTFRPGDLRQPG